MFCLDGKTERRVVMYEKKIKLNAASEVRDFVQAAERCTYDVDVFYNRFIIDAKSLMGVLSLDLNRVLTVHYNEADTEFGLLLDRFAVE